MKIAELKLEHCEKEFPAEKIDFLEAIGGCGSCGWGASATLEISAMCPVCDRTITKEIVV